MCCLSWTFHVLLFSSLLNAVEQRPALNLPDPFWDRNVVRRPFDLSGHRLKTFRLFICLRLPPHGKRWQKDQPSVAFFFSHTLTQKRPVVQDCFSQANALKKRLRLVLRSCWNCSTSRWLQWCLLPMPCAYCLLKIVRRSAQAFANLKALREASFDLSRVRDSESQLALSISRVQVRVLFGHRRGLRATPLANLVGFTKKTRRRHPPF